MGLRCGAEGRVEPRFGKALRRKRLAGGEVGFELDGDAGMAVAEVFKRFGEKEFGKGQGRRDAKAA